MQLAAVTQHLDTPYSFFKKVVSLQTYHLQRPRKMDEGLLLRMIKGIATRVYEEGSV